MDKNWNLNKFNSWYKKKEEIGMNLYASEKNVE